MKTIIVPTDFSAIAVNATQFAIAMAKQIDASLLLLHVYQLPVTVGETPMVVVTDEDMRKDCEEKLAKLKEELLATMDNKIKIYTEVRTGDVVDELKELCETVHPFAVVMATAYANELERLLFGSNTLAAIRHLQVPVLVIAPGVQFKPVQRIGLACNFKDALPSTPEKEIRNVIQEFNAELHVLTVDHGHDKEDSSGTAEQALLMHNMIADLAPQYHFIDKEDIEEGLNELTEKNNIDFLIIIPQKHKFLERLFHKKHTKGLVLHAHVPVMAIHE